MNHRTVLWAGALALALLATGCSGDSGGPGAQERLDEAQEKVASATAITIDLTSADAPANVDGVQAATGTGVIEGDLIKFAGEIKGRVSGAAATVDLIAIGDDTYMKLFTPEFEPVDLAMLGVPNPTAFFASDTGIASLMAATSNVSAGGEVREGQEVLAEITGTLPGQQVNALLNLGTPDGEFAVTYGLTEDNELRKILLAGEFWEATESSYTLMLTDYNQSIPIDAPSP